MLESRRQGTSPQFPVNITPANLSCAGFGFIQKQELSYSFDTPQGSAYIEPIILDLKLLYPTAYPARGALEDNDDDDMDEDDKDEDEKDEEKRLNNLDALIPRLRKDRSPLAGVTL